MKITILGCGTAALNLKKHEAGYLLEHRGNRFLFDSGAGTVYRLIEAGTSPREIDAIFYTHFHMDHICDLPALLWSCEYPHMGPRRGLVVAGPRGFKKYFRILLTQIIRKTKWSFPIDIKEVTNRQFSFGGLNITTQALKHKGDIAYRVESGGRVLVYTGDTDYCPQIAQIAKDADVLIIECGTTKPGNGHMTPELCGKVAAKATVKKLILTHMYPEVEKIDAVGICRKYFKGKVELDRDFMEVKL